MRLLIVEDEPFIAADLESLALDMDHTVVAIADTRSAALDAAERLGADAALVDMRLRDGFTGTSIARALSEDFRLPFAFVTGNPEMIPSGAFGAVAIVQKPFSDVQIAEVLRTLALDVQRRSQPG